MFSFFTGRSNRQEYWISVALLVVAAMVLNYFNMQAASAAITIMWVITWVRRLHDIGMSGFYAAAPLLLLVILVVGVLAFGGQEFIATMQALEAGDTKAITGSGAYLFMGMVAAGLIIQFGFTIWLGAKAGDARGNKFGPPPGDDARG